MKTLIFAFALFSASSAFAEAKIYCSQGDCDTQIFISGPLATVVVCNTDWSCSGQTREVYTLAPELSTAEVSRFVDAVKTVKLEIPAHQGAHGEVDAIINGQPGNNCYFLKD